MVGRLIEQENISRCYQLPRQRDATLLATRELRCGLHPRSGWIEAQTVQHGIHARFESFLFERYRSQLTIAPTPIAPIRDPRNFIFDTIVAGTQLVPPILKSDLDAIGARDVYDDAYYAAFFAANRPVMERRLNEAIAAAARLLHAADMPLVYGMSNTTCEAQKECAALADQLGGLLDSHTSL